ncbi:hypothetical protein [Vitreimonas flagellata]|uniref:hypothetical protein n=1 Tax=Vitreimonas flagellata TaxID=2560861 RepID=UPI0010750AA7|nr:hypothetical protein [Vitreimonas flagellata]
MRRIAFVGVLATGIAASAWFAAQPLADPHRTAPTQAANPNLAHPNATYMTEIGSTLEVAMIQPSQGELAAALEHALLGEECPSEDEAMVKIINATSGVDHEIAAAAVEQVSARAHGCASIDVALGRSRGVAQQAKAPEAPQPPVNEPAFFGTGAPVGGEGGPGYRQG